MYCLAKIEGNYKFRVKLGKCSTESEKCSETGGGKSETEGNASLPQRDGHPCPLQ